MALTPSHFLDKQLIHANKYRTIWLKSRFVNMTLAKTCSSDMMEVAMPMLFRIWPEFLDFACSPSTDYQVSIDRLLALVGTANSVGVVVVEVH